MVLLCGSFHQVVEFLKQLNSGNESVSPARDVFCMPCDSIFPVSIGGLLAWVVIVRRGAANAKQFPNHRERARILTEKRERIAKQRKNVTGKKKRNIHQT